jgi:phage gpG-like protein
MKIKISSNAAQILREVDEFPEQMRGGIARALDRRNQLTVGYIQKEKLTAANPPYLNVRTGRLRGSVRASAAVVSGRRIDSSIGTNVRYAGVHEYGFKGTVQIASFERKASFGREGTERVKAHSRRVDLPARHMFEHGIDENAANYTDDISDAILAAWEGK